MAGLEDLPPEILHEIAFETNTLKVADITALGATCRYLAEVFVYDAFTVDRRMSMLGSTKCAELKRWRATNMALQRIRGWTEYSWRFPDYRFLTHYVMHNRDERDLQWRTAAITTIRFCAYDQDREYLDSFTNGTALSMAAMYGFVELLEELLESGIDVNVKDRSDSTALISTSRLPIVKLLLERGADPNVIDLGDDTPLATACHAQQHDVMRTLLDAGADPNPDVDLWCFPLRISCMKNDILGIEILLDGGADPHHTDRKGSTVLENVKQKFASSPQQWHGAVLFMLEAMGTDW